MTIALPTAPQRRPARSGFPWKSTWIIGSPPKVGKSKFIEGLWRTTGKLVLHLDLENSAEDLDGCVQPVGSLAELRAIAQQLRSNCPYDAIAIDTLDQINTWAEEETCAELGVPVMGLPDTGYGSDWAKARAKVLDLVNQFKMCGKLLLLLVHTKVEKGAFSGVNIAVPQGLGIALRGHSQVIGYIYAMERSGEVVRVISFTPSDSTIAGSRYAELNNRHILIPLRDKDKDGKGWSDWGGIMKLFGEETNHGQSATAK